MTRGLYFNNPEDADDVRKCIVGYINENMDWATVYEDFSDYIVNGSGDSFAFEMENRNIDTILDDLRGYGIDVPDVKNVNELYHFMETQSDEDIETYQEVVLEFDQDTADSIVDMNDSWGNLYLPYDMADYILGKDGAAKIFEQCQDDNDMSDDHIIEIFNKMFMSGKNLEDIGVKVCIEVEIPRVINI